MWLVLLFFKCFWNLHRWTLKNSFKWGKKEKKRKRLGFNKETNFNRKLGFGGQRWSHWLEFSDVFLQGFSWLFVQHCLYHPHKLLIYALSDFTSIIHLSLLQNLWKLIKKHKSFWTTVLGHEEIKLVNPKGNPSWIFIGRTDAEAESPILWPPEVKNWLIDPDAGKDWRWEEKGTTEDEMVGWHHQFSGHEFEQALGVGWSRKEVIGKFACFPGGASDKRARLPVQKP